MFKNPFKKPPAPTPIRDMLFGDAPIEQWPPRDMDNGPFGEFTRARSFLKAGDEASAVECWRRVAASQAMEPRHILQAWTFLRSKGRQPPAAESKRLLGVVVEVGMPEGLDLLAAYPDHTARYLNYSGAGVVWEHPDSSIDPQIDLVLRHGAIVAGRIGPWEGQRPGPPRPNHVRLNLLTPSGLHFGEGPMDVISRDPLGSSLFQAATALMQALIGIQHR